MAIRNNLVEAANTLLRYGADIELRDYFGYTPIMTAASYHSTKTLQLLANHGADTGVSLPVGSGLLHLSASTIHQSNPLGSALETNLLLLQLGLDANAIDAHGVAPVHLYMADAPSMLLHRVVSLDHAPPVNWSTFQWPVFFEYGIFQVMSRALGRATLRRVLNTEPLSPEISPLCRAAAWGSLKGAENILSLGVDIDFEGSGVGSALMIACAYGHEEIIELLVRRGAKITYTDEKGLPRSAVREARKFPKIVRWLLTERFTCQRKLEGQRSRRTSSDRYTGEMKPWSGPHPVEYPCRDARQNRYESGEEYLVRQYRLRRHMRGKIAWGARMLNRSAAA
jgi:hypothetical protein